MIRRQGLDLTVEWKHGNEDSQEKKQPLTAERAWEILKHITGKRKTCEEKTSYLENTFEFNSLCLVKDSLFYTCKFSIQFHLIY